MSKISTVVPTMISFTKNQAGKSGFTAACCQKSKDKSRPKFLRISKHICCLIEFSVFLHGHTGDCSLADSPTAERICRGQLPGRSGGQFCLPPGRELDKSCSIAVAQALDTLEG